MGWMPGKHARLPAARGNSLSSKRTRPLARTDDLVIEDLADEVLVYDRRIQRAHCLSCTAARVWRACDGQTSIDDLNRSLDLDEESVRRALTELQACELLDSGPQRPAGAGMTRRDVTMRAARIGAAAAAVPLIFSVAAPPAEAALTPTIAQCAQYHDKDCDGCRTICGCCCCCQAGSCKTCYPAGLCPSLHCPGSTVADGKCSATQSADCVPAGTFVACKPPNAAQVARPCCTPN
jgi:hypothetical protein